jgi:hypothetical protein
MALTTPVTKTFLSLQFMVLIFHAAAQGRNARLGSGSLRIRRAAAPPRENIFL